MEGKSTGKSDGAWKRKGKGSGNKLGLIALLHLTEFKIRLETLGDLCKFRIIENYILLIH